MIPRVFVIGWPPHISVTRVGSIWSWRILGASIHRVGRHTAFVSRRQSLIDDQEAAR